MIRAYFEEGEKEKTAYGLTQWDYGQKLQIMGLNLPSEQEAVEVHFSYWRGCRPAKIIEATVICDKIIADIPNDFLTEGEGIDAYIYISSSEEGKTIGRVRLPVIKRKKPIDYNASNENQVLKQVLEFLQTKADNITITDGNLQLMSQGQPVGDKVRLNTSGGNEIEIRNNGTTLQWRYTNQNDWNDLVPLEDLKGKDGKPPEFEVRDGHLIAIYS